MARQANIVSFQDAKDASRRRRVQEASEEQRLAGLRNGPVYYDLSRFADPEPAWSRRAQADDQPMPERPRRIRSVSARAKQDVRADDFVDGGLAEFGFSDVESERATRASRADRTGRADRASRARARAKARADKMFDDQYADEPFAANEPDEAPRPALYEAQMGSTQRRAARMQRASEAGSPMVKVNPAGWFTRLDVSVGRLRVITAIACLVLTVAFLYTPAQHYYQSLREHDRLEAELSSIQDRNATLSAQNDSLASNAGMEDAVRQKYGYVVSGDETAVVTGLSDGAANNHGDGVEANVLSSGIKAPEEWYTPYLDALFGVG